MFNDDGKVLDGKAVDVFAVGIIMWELWFRTMPWAGKSIHAILADSLRGVRPPLEGPPTLLNKPKTPIKKKKGDLPPLGPPPPAPLAMKKLMTKCWAQEATARPHLPEIYITFQNEVVPAIEAITHKKSNAPRPTLTPTEAKRRGLVKSKSKSESDDASASATAGSSFSRSRGKSPPATKSPVTSPPTSPKSKPIKKVPSMKDDKLGGALGTAL